MKRVDLLPADTYLVMNKTLLFNSNRQVLTMLYQPIIGYGPISLYFTLWSDLDKTEIMSVEFTHHHLMSKMNLKLEEIKIAREKLEAMGLLKVYFKKGNVNNYVYQLFSPLEGALFLKDPVLSVLLYNNVGDYEFKRIKEYFQIPKLDLSRFEEITLSFNDVFSIEKTNIGKGVQEDLRQVTNLDLSITSLIDFDLLKLSIPKAIINDKAFDEKTKELINKLSFLYKIDNLHMLNIIRGAINEKGFIDKEQIKKLCQNYFKFENDNKLPNLIYQSQPEKYKTKIIDGSKRKKIIHVFETISPYEFLKAKYKGGSPTTRDKRLIETLIVEQNLTPGVVNVLIDYVLKVNDNKLNRNFIETIAGQWKRLNIKTVLEAMRQAEKEHKKYQKGFTSKKKTVSVKEEKVPEWFDKEIKEEELSSEEEAKIKDMLKEYM